MVLFQPFGLQYFQSDHKTLILSGYGLLTFTILFLNLIALPAINPKFLSEDRWTIFKEILWLAWIVSTISAGNYLYSTLFSIVSWVGTTGFTYFLVFTLFIALIPITGISILSYNRMLKKNLALSLEMNSLVSGLHADSKDDTEIILTSETQGQVFRTSLSGLICIESEGNYVNIRYLKEGKLAQTLLRITHKNVEQQMQGTVLLF